MDVILIPSLNVLNILLKSHLSKTSVKKKTVKDRVPCENANATLLIISAKEAKPDFE